MQVFKFGGASVKDASGVKNLTEVLRRFKGEKLVVVVSAMGKTTNALERLLDAWYYKSSDVSPLLQEIKEYHFTILDSLFPDKKNSIYTDIANTFVEIEWTIEDEPQRDYDFEYDQVVSVGELLSTKIVSAYLKEQGIENLWKDVRDFLQTDNTYREGKVQWELTESLAKDQLLPFFKENPQGIILTQGFIGGTSENFTTTLGREGSDYSASIIAFVLEATCVTIWKDVPGVLNADPKWFDDTVMIEQLSYHDAIELAYYGASVIHPKTIKPLQNKHIPLYVKSFIQPDSGGTTINSIESAVPIPSFIFKMNQVLISIKPRDFSFIVEENLSDIFRLFAKHKVKINVMQNSAVSFSVTIDDHEKNVTELVEELKQNFYVLYNNNLELVTIRHYDQPTIDRLLFNKEVLLELKTRNTVQMVVKNL
ncbi:MAG: aspartate kinase [Bacteroidetes bacterium]|nr:aspartate kinase [Bacteroidota bacterium]HET6244169.1 aspartate kinase [Bacteroidia bacterium]